MYVWAFVCLLLLIFFIFFIELKKKKNFFLMGWRWVRDGNVRVTSPHTHLSSSHTLPYVGYFTQHCD